MTVRPRTDVLVAGVGNIFLGDDGFGSEVARRLSSEDLPEGVRVVDYGTAGLHLAYDLADGVGLLVLVDAVADRGAPGTVEVVEAPLDAVRPASIDGHGMDPTAVLAAVRRLGADPPPTFVVTCQAASVAEGMGLSPPVAEAVEPAVRAVVDLVRRARAASRSR